MEGGEGNDTLDGGYGSDVLKGGAGNDTYAFNLGDGQDVITEIEGTDVLRFGPGITQDQLWFARSGNDLVVSIIGRDEDVQIKDWYAGTGNQLEQFRTSEGAVLYQNQVDQLVAAMASFSPLASGEYTLPPDYSTQLEPVIAASWQAT